MMLAMLHFNISVLRCNGRNIRSSYIPRLSRSHIHSEIRENMYGTNYMKLIALAIPPVNENWLCYPHQTKSQQKAVLYTTRELISMLG